MKKWPRRAVAASAIAYVALLIVVAVLMRWLGEAWWATSVALYLPRALFAAPLPFIVVGLIACRLQRLLFTQAIAALVIVFPLMGFVLPRLSFGQGDAPTVRVLSYNVNSGNGGVDGIVEEIERFSPDIVLLQEVSWDTQALEAHLGSHYREVQKSTQFICASRFPIVAIHEPSRLTTNAKDYRSPRFIEQVIDTPLGLIAFYNVHPVSPRGGFYQLRGAGLRREILSGRLFSGERSEAIRAHTELRELQVRVFSELAAHESYPVVIAGDTNLPGGSEIYQRYLAGYQDGFREAGWGFGYTFPANRWPWMRLDRILASEPLKFVHFEVGRSSGSDHRCVVADLTRKDP